jgi:hypothetical protein
VLSYLCIRERPARFFDDGWRQHDVECGIAEKSFDDLPGRAFRTNRGAKGIKAESNVSESAGKSIAEPQINENDQEIARSGRSGHEENNAVRPPGRAFNLTNHLNSATSTRRSMTGVLGRFLASYRRYFTDGFNIIF